MLFTYPLLHAHRLFSSLMPLALLPLSLLLLGAVPAMANNTDVGPLDLPSPGATENIPGKPGVEISILLPANTSQESLVQTQEELREAVVEEQSTLEQLPREQLEIKAERGERAAQVVLGSEYAQEASLLSFAPTAANEALSDAVRWYSLAASRGFPGAPSLDQSGLSFYPIRAQREPRN